MSEARSSTRSPRGDAGCAPDAAELELVLAPLQIEAVVLLHVVLLAVDENLQILVIGQINVEFDRQLVPLDVLAAGGRQVSEDW